MEMNSLRVLCNSRAFSSPAKHSGEGHYNPSCEQWQPNLQLPAHHTAPASSYFAPRPSSESSSLDDQHYYSSNGQWTETASLDHLDVAAAATISTNTWNSSTDDWFSLPFDPSKAPFTA